MIIKKIIPNSAKVTLCDAPCPKCSRIAKMLDYFVDNKEETECPQCGYHSTRNKETNEIKIEYGYGVLYAEFYNKPFVYYVFDSTPTKKEIDECLKIFEDYFIIKERSYFYLYDPDTNTFKVLKGKEPKTFNDYVQEKVDEMEYEKFLSSYRYMSLSNDYKTF